MTQKLLKFIFFSLLLGGSFLILLLIGLGAKEFFNSDSMVAGCVILGVLMLHFAWQEIGHLIDKAEIDKSKRIKGGGQE
jgi:hypothetical protein